MQVDRSRFLLLTAALAVSACNKETETKQDAKAKDAPAAAAKDAPEAAKQDPEPEAKEFGVKGAPDPTPEGNALPPIEPEPEEVPAPSPIKE